MFIFGNNNNKMSFIKRTFNKRYFCFIFLFRKLPHLRYSSQSNQILKCTMLTTLLRKFCWCNLRPILMQTLTPLCPIVLTQCWFHDVSLCFFSIFICHYYGSLVYKAELKLRKYKWLAVTHVTIIAAWSIKPIWK